MVRHWSQHFLYVRGEKGLEVSPRGEKKNLGFAFNKMLNLIISKHLKVVIKILTK